MSFIVFPLFRTRFSNKLLNRILIFYIKKVVSKMVLNTMNRVLSGTPAFQLGKSYFLSHFYSHTIKV